MVDVLFGKRRAQQLAAVGLQLDGGAGAAVAAVVPFQRHDAAAGAQVGGRLAALGLAKPRQ
jgi:hypothetical protein